MLLISQEIITHITEKEARRRAEIQLEFMGERLTTKERDEVLDWYVKYYVLRADPKALLEICDFIRTQYDSGEEDDGDKTSQDEDKRNQSEFAFGRKGIERDLRGSSSFDVGRGEIGISLFCHKRQDGTVGMFDKYPEDSD